MTAHLDDEQLGAHLDGEAGPGTAAIGPHLEACRSGRERLAELRSVAAAVGGPVAPPSPDRRDAALAAAGAAWAAERHGPGTATPLHRRRLAPQVLAAAAAVAAVVVAASVLVVQRGGDGDGFTAAPPPDATTRTETAGPAGPGVDGADLGDHPDAESLARAVQAALAGRAGTGEGASGPGAAPGTKAGGDALAVAPQAATAPPSCAAAARSVVGAGAELVYVASARLGGTPAVVLGYRDPRPAPAPGAGPGGPPHRLVVMAREGCGLLVARAL